MPSESIFLFFTFIDEWLKSHFILTKTLFCKKRRSQETGNEFDVIKQRGFLSTLPGRTADYCMVVKNLTFRILRGKIHHSKMTNELENQRTE